MSKNTSSNPISINIQGKDYHINCAENDKKVLLASARLLNEKMSEIRDSSNSLGGERLAIMAALEIAHDLVTLQDSTRDYNWITTEISVLNDKIAESLQPPTPDDTITIEEHATTTTDNQET